MLPGVRWVRSICSPAQAPDPCHCHAVAHVQVPLWTLPNEEGAPAHSMDPVAKDGKPVRGQTWNVVQLCATSFSRDPVLR